VRIYMRVLPSVESTPVWGAQRHDTVYDAIMGHYTSQRAPGAYMTEYLQVGERGWWGGERGGGVLTWTVQG
jgi:hypothetical protein